MKCAFFFSLLVWMAAATTVSGQSITTDALREKYPEALQLFFYNNTLRMLNQNNDPDFDELIRDIEKMRFLMIRKTDTGFGNDDFSTLVSNYKSEAFEEAMTSRHDGKNFDVYLKEKDGKTNGMLVLINDPQNLFVLDILGFIALDKVTSLYNTLGESSDIGKKIKAFTGDDDDKD